MKSPNYTVMPGGGVNGSAKAWLEEIGAKVSFRARADKYRPKALNKEWAARSIDFKGLHSECWNRTDGYFCENWWQDPEKLKEAAEMLKEEARLLGGIDLPLLNGQYRADEKNHRIYAVQALANVLRTGSYDVETVYHLEMNYLTADMDYTRANDVLSVKGIELLQKRQKEILLKEAGDWVERTGLVGTVRGLAQLSIMTSNYFAANGIKLAKKSPKIKDTKVKGVGGAKNILKAGSKADAIKSVNNLPSKIQAKVKSFFKGSSNSYTNYSVKAKSDGSYIAEMTKPGNVPGSKAIYYKEIDSMGNTIKVYKKTYDPTGKLVHTKNK